MSTSIVKVIPIELQGCSTELKKLENLLRLLVNDATHWPAVCDEVANIFDAVGAIIMSVDPNFRGIWMPQSEVLSNLTDAYLAGGWHLKDYRQRFEPMLFEKLVCTDDDLGDRSLIQQHPYYSDLMIPHGVGFCMVIHIPTSTGRFVISIQFAHDRPAMSDQERNTALQIKDMLCSYSEKAIESSQRRIAELAGMMSESAHRSATLDCTGQVIQTHQSSLAEPKWNLDDVPQDHRNEIQNICRSDPAQNISGGLEYETDQDRRRLSIFQLPKTLRHFCIPDKVLLIETKSELSSHPWKFQQKYNLTDAELNCVSILAKGHTVVEIAELSSVKTTTIRQRLKAIYEKVDVSSQAQLVAKFLKIN